MQRSKWLNLGTRIEDRCSDKERGKIQQRWAGCQITGLLFWQGDVPSTRRSDESRRALRRERTVSSVLFLFGDLKKRTFETGERSRLSENSRAETRGNDKRNQPILDFLRLLLWKRCNVFADGILWWWLYCLFSLWVFLSGWICTHLHTHPDLTRVGKKERWMRRKMNDRWSSMWEDE